MSSDDVVVRVSCLAKRYHIYKAPQDRIKQFFIPRFQQLLGRQQTPLYQEFRALDDVSFKIRKGETFGVIGRNGAGKSTLLQMICGTLNPTSGEIDVRGRVAALLELGAGFNPEFSGRENVYMNATLLGLTSDQIDARLPSILEFADIGSFIEQPVKTYSSGMYVRLAFAVMVHVDADILVIDEALAVGDVFFTQKCMRFLREFVQRGTLIFVTHDINSVMSFCSRAVWLENGRQRMLGGAKEVCEAYLEQLYAGQVCSDSEMASTESERGEEKASDEFVGGTDVEDYADFRQSLVNSSNLRNDLRVFRFDAAASAFGTKLVDVLEVYLADVELRRLAWVVGGEMVNLVIRVSARKDLVNPIVGFVVKDKLGQTLFGDNTYLMFEEQSIRRKAGSFQVRFKFRMPYIPAGDYSVAIAVAEGTQQDHVVHAWIHDALVFSSQASAVATGLLGIPMLEIAFE